MLRVLTKPVFEGSLRAMLHLAEERRKGLRQQTESPTNLRPPQPVSSSQTEDTVLEQNSAVGGQ